MLKKRLIEIEVFFFKIYSRLGCSVFCKKVYYCSYNATYNNIIRNQFQLLEAAVVTLFSETLTLPDLSVMFLFICQCFKTTYIHFVVLMFFRWESSPLRPSYVNTVYANEGNYIWGKKTKYKNHDKILQNVNFLIK